MSRPEEIRAAEMAEDDAYEQACRERLAGEAWDRRMREGDPVPLAYSRNPWIGCGAGWPCDACAHGRGCLHRTGGGS